MGSVVPGRGIEECIRSLPGWPERFHFTVRGPVQESYLGRLHTLAHDCGVSDRVTFAPPVPMVEMIRRAAESDIGIFVLPADKDQSTYVLPNKLFEYLMAGLAVAVSATPEMAAVVNAHDAGLVIQDLEPACIAAAMMSLDNARIDRFKRNALTAAQTLNWEQESRRLVEAYTAAVWPARGRACRDGSRIGCSRPGYFRASGCAFNMTTITAQLRNMGDIKESNILVVGGAGFVGSNLVRVLLQHAPRRVTIVDNFLSADPVNVPDSPVVRLVVGSIADDRILHELDPDLDYAFHLACYHGNQSSIHNPLADHANNTLTSLKLFERLKDIGSLRKVVYAAAGCAVAEKTFGGALATTEDAPVSLFHDSPYRFRNWSGKCTGTTISSDISCRSCEPDSKTSTDQVNCWAPGNGAARRRPYGAT